jgi:hypothetical protein
LLRNLNLGPLSAHGTKRTDLDGRAIMSAYDPKRTMRPVTNTVKADYRLSRHEPRKGTAYLLRTTLIGTNERPPKPIRERLGEGSTHLIHRPNLDRQAGA